LTTYEGPLLWCDLETTGLDPIGASAAILEVGLVLTDGPMLDIREGGEASLIIRPAGTQMDHDRMWAQLPEEVRNMHAATGLWQEATTGDTAWSIHDADEALARWLIEKQGVTEKLSLCGSGVERFDRPWLQQWMPRLFSMLTYYSVWDLGTHRRALQYTGRGDLVDLVANVDNKPHRALEDCHLHIAEAKKFAALYALLPYTMYDQDADAASVQPTP